MENWEAYFKRQCEDQLEKYRSEILPLYIEKYYFGAGYYFVAQMLSDHDSGKIMTQKADLSQRAIRLAARALRNCPLRVDDSLERGPRGGIVMGRFLHSESFQGRGFIGGFGPSEYKELAHERHVVLYSGSFLQWMEIQRNAPGQLDLSNEILTTIFHEYIHFFESFFLKRDQPLATRETDPRKEEILSLRDAKSKDRIAVAWKIIWRIAVVLILLGVSYVIISDAQ